MILCFLQIIVNHLDAIVPLVTIGFEHTRPIVHWVIIDTIDCLYQTSHVEIQLRMNIGYLGSYTKLLCL
jgi:hypothetical protein